MAATWDTELIYEVGAAFGQESLQSGLNGWYCPAINLHCSVFNSRVFEFYSGDPVLSGKLATAIMPAQNCVGTTVGHANYAPLL